MPHLPKIVSQRLNSPTSDLHPDADLLAAFAEKSLAKTERACIIDHLARCTDCREIVALALPAIEEPTIGATTVVGARTTSRMTWFLRWGVVAAGLTLAVLGVLQLRQRHSAQVAYSPLRRVEVAATSAPVDHLESDRMQDGRLKKDVPHGSSADQEADLTPTSKTDTEEKKFAPNRASRVPPEGGHGDTAKAVPSLGTRGSSSGQATKFAIATPPRDLNFAQSFRSSVPPPKVPEKQLSPQPSAPAPIAETVEVTAAAPVMEAGEAGGNDRAQSELSLDKGQVAKAKPPVSNGDVSAAAAAGPREARAPVPAQSEVVEVSSAAASRWTITGDGALQRSVDGGKTWTNVNVEKSSPNTHYALMRNVPAKSETAGAGKPGSAASKAKFTGTTPVFRAVSAAGAEVWAGGMSGILYHSSDGGYNWSRVIPTAAGITLLGDIITIEFTDQQNGRLTTSHAEIWTTADAGQSWQKQ